VSPALAQRQLILAGVALLGLVAALAVAAGAGGSSASTGNGNDLSSVAPAGGGWYRGLAAAYRLDPRTKRTACGQRATPDTLGVAHPVLPCGAKIVLRYGNVQVLTQVIDRGTGVPGREFDVTAALAHRIGLAGVQPIRWRFAAAP
jgi:rare lipoprotein A (peptidoglycan hydrolase)